MTSTKLNAEELAAKRYIVMPWEKEEDRRLFEELNAIAYREREAYADAIREVAQPIADERDELRYAAQCLVDRWDSPSWKNTESTALYINDLRRVLAKYPKP